MIDFELTEEQKALQKMAREFAEKEIRPIAEKLDRSQNLLQDFPWEMIKKADKLGLRTIGLPKEYGGPEFDLRTWVVLIDELSYPDVSCAKILTQCWKGARRLAQQGTKEQKDRFLPAFRDDPTYLLGGARTEPGSGSDNQLPYEAPEAGVMLTAQRQGDHYILNGRKHFISNSPVAKMLVVTARTDKTVGGVAGSRSFIVPTDTPGFRVASVHDKGASACISRANSTSTMSRCRWKICWRRKEGGVALRELQVKSNLLPTPWPSAALPSTRP